MTGKDIGVAMAENPKKARNTSSAESSSGKAQTAPVLKKTRTRAKSVKSQEKERIADVAKCFKALGEPTRLQIIQCLHQQWQKEPMATVPAKSPAPKSVMGAQRGVSITELCHAVTGATKISSTFSHHIKELRRVGLIRVERAGKNRWCHIEPTAFQVLLPFVTPVVAPITATMSRNDAPSEPILLPEPFLTPEVEVPLGLVPSQSLTPA